MRKYSLVGAWACCLCLGGPGVGIAQVAASVPAETSTPAPVDWAAIEQARLQACIAKSETDPDGAYEDGQQWHARGGGQAAMHCIAVALIARGEIDRGATILMSMASAPDGGSPQNRALLLSKAANAWMMVEDTSHALVALSRAIAILPSEQSLYVDRATARMIAHEWADAERDLNAVIAAQPNNGMAYRLRAEARMQLGQLDNADSDIIQALRLEPDVVDNFVVRGRVREARRLGRPPD